MHIYGILNNGTDEPVCRAGLEMQMQRMDSGTQRRKEGMSRENSIAMCEQRAGGKLPHSVRSSAQCCDDLEAGMGLRGEAPEGGSWLTLLCSRNEHNIVKQLYAN